jgi:peptidyl-prolyl cis-trans isomerase SurA
MMNKLLVTVLFFVVFSLNLFAQQDDPVLFSVDKTPVTVSEFKYIYSKTNQEKADFSEASLREYLDLYEKFKLKVQRAKDMRLDTVPALRQELDGYRTQLANSYLVDKEVTDRLIRETYDRSKSDVEISHIFFNCEKNAKPADTLIAYNKAIAALNRIKKGEKFEEVAASASEDKTAKDTKGKIGFVNAMFPDGFFTMETAAYSMAAGELWKVPVRSNTGYHLVRLESIRPAYGEIEVAQILIRKSEGAEKAAMAKIRIDSIYTALKNGSNWDQLTLAVSQDQTTAAKGGYIGFLGINKYQKSFEDAAFAVAKDGDFSKPVETTIGWHIIKRISKKATEPFEKAKRALGERVKRDGRSEIAKQSMIERIKKEGGFAENSATLNKFIAAQVDSVFLTYRWKAQESKPQDPLFSFTNGRKFTVADFEEYLIKAGRTRMKGVGVATSADVATQLYRDFVGESCLKYEETQLDRKYPEFKNLMREYEEGILLFDATKQLVWDKANVDSIGLEKYFNESLRTKYQWEERAVVSTYTIKTTDEKLKGKIMKMLAKKSATDVMKKFNKKGEIVSVTEKITEKSKLKDGIIGQAGWMSQPMMDEKAGTTSIKKVEKMLPVGSKSLNEARGYAVADYQDYLEKQWVEDLRKAYKITLNEAVLKGMVGKRP